MQKASFRGTGVALVTPFKKGGAVDYDALEQLIERVLAGGVDFLVSLGTTGEAITLTSRECQEILTFTVRIARERAPVVGGYFGANSTSHLIERIKNVNFDGVSAILSSSPAYNKPTQEGIFQHYMAVEKKSPVPIILYNVPGRTASNMAPETVVRLAKASDKFIGVKEASGNLGQAISIIKDRPEGFLCLSGDDPLTMPMIACGGEGVISVIANAFPAEFSGLVKAALQGDFVRARQLNDQLWDVHPLLYVEGNPVGIKAAMEILGQGLNEFRLPLVPMSAPNYERLKKQIDAAMAVAHA